MSERGYVVGDLHLGAGPDDPLEDFREDEAFARLCERIAGPDTTLILNGDIIDFAQIPPFDVPKPAHLLWPEAASLIKAQTALAAHPDFFAGLQRFVERGGRVRCVIGNHDLDMVWPEVQRCIAERLGAPPGDRLSFVIGATELHGVHVEHGHHFTPENCPRTPLEFLHPGPGGVPHLERVWGTDFMLQFYNQLERDHPFADKVKPMLTVVWHGLRKRWIGGRELARLFLFLRRRGLPWRGLASALLDEPQPLTAASAASSFDDPAWKQAVLERARTDPGFVAELNQAIAELEPLEQRLAAHRDQIETVDPRSSTGGEATSGATLGLFREERELRAAREHLARPGITHVVFGHTHVSVDGELDGRLYNYGTWIPSLDLRAAHVKARLAAEGLSLEVLRDRSLYTVARHLVRIDAPAASAGEAKVRLVTDDEP
jgi:UDP-2,3-diacylglucosamine pyrophosphatase LpxH